MSTDIARNFTISENAPNHRNKLNPKNENNFRNLFNLPVFKISILLTNFQTFLIDWMEFVSWAAGSSASRSFRARGARAWIFPSFYFECLPRGASIRWYIEAISQVDDFLNSQHLVAWQGIDIARRIYTLQLQQQQRHVYLPESVHEISYKITKPLLVKPHSE